MKNKENQINNSRITNEEKSRTSGIEQNKSQSLISRNQSEIDQEEERIKVQKQSKIQKIFSSSANRQIIKDADKQNPLDNSKQLGKKPHVFGKNIHTQVKKQNKVLPSHILSQSQNHNVYSQQKLPHSQQHEISSYSQKSREKSKYQFNRKQEMKIEPERNFLIRNQRLFQDQQEFKELLDLSSIQDEKLPQIDEMKKKKLNEYIENLPHLYPQIKKIHEIPQTCFELDFSGAFNFSGQKILTSVTKVLRNILTLNYSILNQRTRPFEEFIQNYNKYRSYFKSMFTVKKIIIGKYLSVKNKMKLFQTKWEQLKEVVIYDDQDWFLTMKDLSILKVLLINNSKYLKKVELHLFFLLPQYIEELSEMKLPKQFTLEIHVKQMTSQAYMLLQNMEFRSDSQLNVVFEIKKEQPKIVMNIEILQQNGYKNILSSKNLNQIILQNFVSKWKHLLAIPLINTNQHLPMQLQQESDIDRSKVSKHFELFYRFNTEHKFELKTRSQLNLNQLFTQFQWNQLQKIFFYHPVKFQEFEIFVQSSHKFQNLQSIELLNIQFQFEEIPYLNLKEFKQLKYFIINQNTFYDQIVKVQKISYKQKKSQKQGKLLKVQKRLQLIYQISEQIYPIRVVVKDYRQNGIDESESIRKKFNSFKQFKDEYYHEGSKIRDIYILQKWQLYNDIHYD